MGKTVEEFEVKWGGDASGYKKAAKEAQTASEGFLEGEKKVENAAKGFTLALGQSKTSADLLAAAADNLENTFRGSLGVSVAVAAGLSLKAVLDQEAESMKRVAKLTQEALAPGYATAGQSAETFAAQIDKASAAQEELLAQMNDKTPLRTLANLGGMAGLAGIAAQKYLGFRDEQDQRQNQSLEDFKLQKQKDITVVMREQAGIQDALSRGLTYQAGIAQRRLQMESEIAKLGTFQTPAMVDSIKAKYEAMGRAADAAEKKTSSDRQMAGFKAATGFGAQDAIDTADMQLLHLYRKVAIEEKLSGTQSDQYKLARYQVIEQQKQLELMKAAKTVADSKFAADLESVKIEGTSATEAYKRHNITLAQIKAVDAEIAAMRQLNPELARAAQLRKEGLENDLAQQDRDLNMGKSARDSQKRFRNERKSTREREQFDQSRKDSSGLTNVRRDMDGNVTGGTDPVTNEWVDKSGDAAKNSGLNKPLPGMDNLKPRLGDKFKEDTERFRNIFKPRNKDDDFNPIDANQPVKAPTNPVVDAIVDLKNELMKEVIK